MAYIVKKLEYMLKNQTWTAYIAGRSANEIVNYLKKTVGNNINVTQISDVGRLDAVTDELRQIIAKPFVDRAVQAMQKSSKKEKTKTEETKTEEKPKKGPGRPRKTTTKEK